MEFRVLGPLELRIGDEEVVDLGGPKQRQLLLSLLVDVGRSRSADQLAEDDPGPNQVRVSSWIPPAHASDPPPELDGARGDLQLAHQPSRHYLATLGRLRYLMVLRGDASALASPPAEAIMESFRCNSLPIRTLKEPLNGFSGSIFRFLQVAK